MYDKDVLLDSSSTIKLLHQGLKDAQSVREAASSRREPSVPQRDGPRNISQEFTADDELFGSGPYIGAFYEAGKGTARWGTQGLLPPSQSNGDSNGLRRDSAVGSIGMDSVKPVRSFTPGPRGTGAESTQSPSTSIRAPVLSTMLQPFQTIKNARDAASNTQQLCEACREGNQDWATFLVEVEHTNVNHLDKRGLPPLYYAVIRGDLPLVEYLCDRGAKKNGPDNRSSAMVYAAVRKNHLPILKYLASNGAEVNSP